MRPSCQMLVTCEHASRAIPADLMPHFVAGSALLGGPCDDVVHSHRGWDPGAAQLAQCLCDQLKTAPPLLGEVSRLVIDLNRSIGHPRLYSPVTRALPPWQRLALRERFYRPHHAQIDALIASAVSQGRQLVHVACHSFTPVWADQLRAVELGILYDPRRPAEGKLARLLAMAIRATFPAWRVRFNQPYRGRADGLPSRVRKAYADNDYVGLEIEVNQALVAASGWQQHCHLLAAAMCRALLQ